MWPTMRDLYEPVSFVYMLLASINYLIGFWRMWVAWRQQPREKRA